MPSNEHEVPLEFFRGQPRLAPELLREVFGVRIPVSDRYTLGSEAYSDTAPAEYRCDATVLVGDPHAPNLGIVVEMQLRYSRDKTFSWPAYLSLLRARRKCPVALLVLCPDERTADACRRPIDLGHPGWMLTPLAVALPELPAVTDPARIRELPELAILSAPYHADGPDALNVLAGAALALNEVPDEQAPLYRDYVESRLSPEALELLEAIVTSDTYQYQSKTARRYFSEGEARGQAAGEARGEAHGEARAVLRVLRARGVKVSDAVRETITSCTDIEQLDRWIDRVADVERAEDLFEV